MYINNYIIYIAYEFEYKNHSEIKNSETFLSFFVRSYEGVLCKIQRLFRKLSLFLRTPYDVLPDGEWTDVAER
jgi:hypothetical protein